MILACVILNYNDSETTISLINRIKNFSVFDYLVIVDNCSTDESYEHLKRFSSDRIIVLSTPRNGGYGYGNNYGISYSYYELKSDYTLIVNPDVEFDESTVHSLLKIMQQNKDCAISSCKPVNRNKKMDFARKHTNGLHDVLSASLIMNRCIGARYYNEDYFKDQEICDVYEVPGSFLLVKTPLMVKYGLYDEEFFLFEEEKVLAHKMTQNDLKTLLSLKNEYIHNHSVSISKSYKSSVDRKRLLLNSKYTFIKKYRKFNRIQLFMARVFFKYAIFEMYLYSKYLECRKILSN